MRANKLKRSKIIVKKHIAHKLDIVNRWRTRRAQAISLDARPHRDPRPGQHRKWTESATLRLCFHPRLPPDALQIYSTRQRAMRRRTNNQIKIRARVKSSVRQRSSVLARAPPSRHGL